MQRLTFDHLPQPAHGPELAVVWPAGDVTSVRKGVQSWFPSIASFAAQ